MPYAIAICAFFGTWLLVAGSVYQAAIELDRVQVDRARLAQAKDAQPPPPPASRWWWLLPPVAVLIHAQRSRRYRSSVLSALTRSEAEQWFEFSDKAIGWIVVGSGGLLLAAKETWSMTSTAELPSWSLWIVFAAMLALCASFTVYRLHRSHGLLRSVDERRSTRAGHSSG
jgi:hypothetical protein